MNTIDHIQHTFLQKIKELFALEATHTITIDINDDAKKQNFGDLSSNAALIIAKMVGENPRTIAQKIIANFIHPALERMDIAGPGFINFFLTDQALQTISAELFSHQENFFKQAPDAKKIFYNVEFVSANPTGPLHLGHGRNGIIGDVLGNVLLFIGHHVTKEFYINDAGSQMQKLGLSLKARCQQLLGQEAEIPEEGYHGEYLREIAENAIAHDKKNIEEKIANTQPDALDFFINYAREKLLAQQKNTLDAYGIHFDVWFSEKVLHINGAVEGALKFLEQKNLTYVEEGALWFKSTAFGDDKDRVLKRSNGEVTYMAADVAYTQDKIFRGAEKVIIVVGQDHHGYVHRMKAVMESLERKAEDMEVLLYQLVTIKESGQSVRMSKRAGRIVGLEDIIETVGADVARFFFLNRKADAHLVFDIDLALKRTEENPVYYIQYAYVRTNSMFEKANEHQVLHNIKATDLYNLDEQEKLLLKKICALKVLLYNISKNYQTHLLTYYLLDLANLFHSYYGSHKVIDLENIATSRKRLALVKLVQKTLQLCMKLLGISNPEKM
jgi:arginyl-tRNA synthetase